MKNLKCKTERERKLRNGEQTIKMGHVRGLTTWQEINVKNN